MGIALGSTGGRVLRMILGESIIPIIVGLGIGLPCALAAVRMVVHMLFVSPLDPVTLAIVAVAFVVVGAVAGYLPARRATKLDPMTALRHE